MKRNQLLLTAIALMFNMAIFGQTEAEMKAWQTYMTPGEIHQMLASYDGEWNAEISMWMAPDTKPTETKAVTRNKMILGGRYQESTSIGKMMGMAFEGRSLMGYDNNKKIITAVWIDNFGTGTLVMEGSWDPGSKVISFGGVMVDPMSGKDIIIREEMTFVDADTQEMDMYETRDGKEFKSMHITYKRKK